eukprot:2043408-Pyramimonas_sp.AAC.2
MLSESSLSCSANHTRVNSMTELINHAPPLTTTTTTTLIERFQISDGSFLEIRNYGEIVKKLSRVRHDLPKIFIINGLLRGDAHLGDGVADVADGGGGGAPLVGHVEGRLSQRGGGGLPDQVAEGARGAALHQVHLRGEGEAATTTGGRERHTNPQSMESWKHGSMEAWKHGNMEASKMLF